MKIHAWLHLIAFEAWAKHAQRAVQHLDHTRAVHRNIRNIRLLEDSDFWSLIYDAEAKEKPRTESNVFRVELAESAADVCFVFPVFGFQAEAAWHSLRSGSFAWSRWDQGAQCEDIAKTWKIPFASWLAGILGANCMSTKFRHATLACLSAFVSPVASTFECSSLVNFCSRCSRSSWFFLYPLQNWTVKGPKSAREGRSDIEPVKRPAGVRIKTACTGDAASFSEHKELVLKKQYI